MPQRNSQPVTSSAYKQITSPPFKNASPHGDNLAGTPQSMVDVVKNRDEILDLLPSEEKQQSAQSK